jgi:hypothetical protein
MLDSEIWPYIWNVLRKTIFVMTLDDTLINTWLFYFTLAVNLHILLITNFMSRVKCKPIKASKSQKQ